MRALIYKDIVSIKKSLSVLAIIMLIIAVAFIKEGQMQIFPLSFLFIAMILMGLFFGKDAMSNIEQYILPAPIKRSTIVLSRYVEAWAIAGTGTAFALIIQLFDKRGAFDIPWYALLPGTFLLTSLISAIQLPVLYKFGVEKGRFVFTLTYIMFFSGVSYLGNNKELFIKFVEIISNTNTAILGAILALLAIIINAASYGLSVYIYSSKEF